MRCPLDFGPAGQAPESVGPQDQTREHRPLVVYIVTGVERARERGLESPNVTSTRGPLRLAIERATSVALSPTSPGCCDDSLSRASCESRPLPRQLVPARLSGAARSAVAPTGPGVRTTARVAAWLTASVELDFAALEQCAPQSQARALHARLESGDRQPQLARELDLALAAHVDALEKRSVGRLETVHQRRETARNVRRRVLARVVGGCVVAQPETRSRARAVMVRDRAPRYGREPGVRRGYRRAFATRNQAQRNLLHDVVDVRRRAHAPANHLPQAREEFGLEMGHGA